jgi:hypothetical protein
MKVVGPVPNLASHKLFILLGLVLRGMPIDRHRMFGSCTGPRCAFQARSHLLPVEWYGVLIKKEALAA